MRSAIYYSLVVLIFLFLITMPSATADNGDGNETDEIGVDEGCIFTTFCMVMLFLVFLIYLSSRHKSEESRARQERGPFQTPPPRQGYRYPTPHRPYPAAPTQVYPQKPELQKKDVKCKLCGSKNVRIFEGGYFTCNDCRHVFYITEMYRRSRRRL